MPEVIKITMEQFQRMEKKYFDKEEEERKECNRDKAASRAAKKINGSVKQKKKMSFF